MLLDVFDPSLDVLERLLICDVVHQENSLEKENSNVSSRAEDARAVGARWRVAGGRIRAYHGPAVVRSGDGSEPLLAGGVPEAAEHHTVSVKTRTT